MNRMKKAKKKIYWQHAIKLGLAQIGDGLVTLLTLGYYRSEMTIEVAQEIGKWRMKRKEKLWR